MDRIAKEKLNIILLVDASKSMQGKRIKQVDQAIADIKSYLLDFQDENANIDFAITIIPFANDATFYDNSQAIDINKFNYHGIKCGGWSNLHLAYDRLNEILQKESNGGIMPDFGGVAPIILLLTDGHPTSKAYKASLETLSTSPWFKAAVRYGIAVELDDDRTTNVLSEFCGNNGDVIRCYNADMLKDIIKVIVISASQVKSSGSKVNFKVKANVSQCAEIKQTINDALSDLQELEW